MLLRITSRLLAVALCVVVLLMPVVLVSFLSDTLDVTTKTILPPLWSSALRSTAAEIALHRFQAAVGSAYRADALVTRAVPTLGYPKNDFVWNASRLCNNVADALTPPNPTRPPPDGTIKWGRTRAGDDARLLRDILLEARMVGTESMVPVVLFPLLKRTPIPGDPPTTVNASMSTITQTSTTTTTTSTSTTTVSATSTTTTTTTAAPGVYVPLSCPFPNLGFDTMFLASGVMRDDWRSSAASRDKLPGNGTMALSFLHCPLDSMQIQTISQDMTGSTLMWPHIMPLVQWFPVALPSSTLPREQGCRRSTGERQVALLVSRLLDKRLVETNVHYVEPDAAAGSDHERTRTQTQTRQLPPPYKIDRTLSKSMSLVSTHTRIDTSTMGAVAVTFDRQLALEALASVPIYDPVKDENKMPRRYQDYFSELKRQKPKSHLDDILKAVGGSAVGAIMWDTLYDVGMVGDGESRGLPSVAFEARREIPRRDTRMRCDLYSATSSGATASASSSSSAAAAAAATGSPGATTAQPPLATADDAKKTSAVKSSFTIDETRSKIRDFCPVQIDRDLIVDSDGSKFSAVSSTDVERFREQLSLFLDEDNTILDRYRMPAADDLRAAEHFFAGRFIGGELELENNATEAMLLELGRQKLNVSRGSDNFKKLTKRKLAEAAAQTPEWLMLRVQRQRRMQELITGPAVDFSESLELALEGNSSSLVYVVPQKTVVRAVVGGLIAGIDLYVMDIVPRAVFDVQQDSWLTSIGAAATVSEKQTKQNDHPSSLVDTHSAFAFEDLGQRIARHSYPYKATQYACSIDVTAGDDVLSPVDFELQQLRDASPSAARQNDDASKLQDERCVVPRSFAVMRRITILVLADDPDNILGVDIFSGPVAATVIINIVMTLLAAIFVFVAFDSLFVPLRELATILRNVADDQIREIAPAQLSRVREIRDAQLATEGLVAAVQLYSRFLPSRSLLMDSNEMDPRVASVKYVETQSTFIDAIVNQYYKIRGHLAGDERAMKSTSVFASGGAFSSLAEDDNKNKHGGDADEDDSKLKRQRKYSDAAAGGSANGGDGDDVASADGSASSGENDSSKIVSALKIGPRAINVNGRHTVLGFRKKPLLTATTTTTTAGSLRNRGGDHGSSSSSPESGGTADPLLGNLEYLGENQSDDEDELGEEMVNTDLQEEFLRMRNAQTAEENTASSQIVGVPHTLWIKATYRSRRDPARVRSTYEPKKHCSFRQTFHCGEDVYQMVLDEVRRRVSERVGEPLQLRDVGYDALPVTMGETGQVTSLDADLQGSKRLDNTADFLQAVERAHGRPLYLAMIKTSKRNFVPWAHAIVCIMATVFMFQISKDWEQTPLSDIPKDAAKAIVVFLSLRFAFNLLFSATLLLWFCHVQPNFYAWMCLAVPEVVIACVLSAFSVNALYVLFSAISLRNIRFNAPFNPMMAVTSRYALVGHVLGDALGMIPLGYAAAFEGSSVVSGVVVIAILFSLVALLMAFFLQPLMGKIAELLPGQFLATTIGDTQDFAEWDAPSAAALAAAAEELEKQQQQRSASAVSTAESTASSTVAAAAAMKLLVAPKQPPMNLCEREASIVKLTLRDTASHVERLSGIHMAQLVQAVTDLAAREAEVYGGLILRVMGTEVTVGFNCHHVQNFHILSAAKFFFAMERAVRAKMAEWPLAHELECPQLVGALVSGASLAVGYIGTAEARSVQHLGIGEVLLQSLLGLSEHLGAMFLTTRQTAGALQLQAEFSRKTFEADKEMRSRARDRVIKSFNIASLAADSIGINMMRPSSSSSGSKGGGGGKRAGGGGGGGGKGFNSKDGFSSAVEQLEAESKKREMNAFAAFFAELDDATSDIDIILLHSMRVREVDGISITLPAYHRDRFRSALDLDGIAVSSTPYERDLSVFEVTTALSQDDLAHFNREVENLLRGPPQLLAAQTVAGGGFAHYCTGHPGDFVAQRMKFINTSRNPTGRNVRFVTPLGIGFRRVELRLAQLAANAKTREEIEEEEAELHADRALEEATKGTAGAAAATAAAAAARSLQQERKVGQQARASGGSGGARTEMVMQRIQNKDNYTLYFTDL